MGIVVGMPTWDWNHPPHSVSREDLDAQPDEKLSEMHYIR